MKNFIAILSLISIVISCKKEETKPSTTNNSETNPLDTNHTTKRMIWDTVFSGSSLDFREEYFAINQNTGVLAVNTPTTVKLLKTIDGGKNWDLIDTKITTLEVRSIAFQNKDLGYISFFGKGVYKTEDGGVSWSKIYDCTCGLTADSESLTILNQNEILYSTDKGATFTKQTTDFWLFQNPISSFRFGNEVYSYFAEGLLKSTDSGKTWENTNVNFSSITSITPISKLKWYLISKSNLFVTEDAGKNWEQVDNENYYYLSAAKKDTLFVNRNNNLYWTIDGKTFNKDEDYVNSINLFSIGDNILGFNNNVIYRRKY